MKVKRKDLDTAPLVTVDEHADDLGQYAGAFVRIRPSAVATDSQLRKLKKGLLDAGAKAVRLMPKPPADQLQLSAGAQLVEQMTAGNDATPPVRELMAQLVAASTSRHKAQLGALLVRLADEEGL